jgi:uncharacterized membrane protein
MARQAGLSGRLLISDDGVDIMIPVMFYWIRRRTMRSKSWATKSRRKLSKAPHLDRRFAAVILPVSLLLIGVSIYVATDSRNRYQRPTAAAIHAVGDHVTILRSSLTGGAPQFFEYMADGQTSARFFIFARSDSTFQAALDSCETCSNAGFAYDGAKMTCTACGQSLPVSSVGLTAGACNPIALPHRLIDENITIRVADLTHSR